MDKNKPWLGKMHIFTNSDLNQRLARNTILNYYLTVRIAEV